MAWVILPNHRAWKDHPLPGSPDTADNQQCPVMEFAWLEKCWARPFYLAFVFFLTLGLLQAIKFYVRRQQLLRDLRAFPGPAPHWFSGNQKVDGREGRRRMLETRRAERRLCSSLSPSFLAAQTCLAQPVALRVFSFLWTCSLTALQGKGHALEPLAGDFSGWEEVFQKIESGWEGKESLVQLWTVSASSISCTYVLHF